jgi:hypothetical protein
MLINLEIPLIHLIHSGKRSCFFVGTPHFTRQIPLCLGGLSTRLIRYLLHG